MCSAETVTLDARLKNWRFGQAPLLAYGKFLPTNELVANRPESALLSNSSLPYVAFFYSVDLLQRFSVLDVEWVKQNEIRAAIQRIFTVAERFVDEASASYPEAAGYNGLLSQARLLDDSDLQLGVLEVVADWLIQIKNEEAFESLDCKSAQAAEIAGAAASFGDER